MASNFNYYSDRAVLMMNGNIILEPADVNRIQFTFSGNFAMEDGMTTDGSAAGFTYKNRSATVSLEAKIPNSRPFPNLFDISLYDGNIIQIQIMGVRNLSTGDYNGNTLILPNCKYIDNGTSGYSRAGTAAVMSINFASTDYVWAPQ